MFSFDKEGDLNNDHLPESEISKYSEVSAFLTVHCK